MITFTERDGKVRIKCNAARDSAVQDDMRVESAKVRFSVKSFPG